MSNHAFLTQLVAQSRRRPWLRACMALLAALAGVAPTFVNAQREIAAGLSFTHQAATDHPARPGRWSCQRVTFTNPTSDEQQAACVSYALTEPFRQYGRTVSVPARARRRIVYPLRIPDRPPNFKKPLEVKTELLQVASSAGRPPDHEAPRVVREALVVLDLGEQATAVLADDQQTELLVRISRVMAGLSSRLYAFREDWTLPATEESLSAFDHMVIASDRFLEDPQGVIAVRHWLQQGGRVWVLLDKTKPEVLAALLGDAWTGALLDRTSVVQFQLVDNRPVAGRRDGAQHVLDAPVDLALVDSGRGEVDYVVGGWPTAIRFPCGRGSLLVTTLGPRGWYAELPPQILDRVVDREVAQQLVKQSARMPLGLVARSFLQPTPPPQVSPATLRSAARQRIGYQAPRRWVVATVLGSLFGGLVGAGVLFHRAQRSAWSLALAPAAALVAAGVLVVAGHASRTHLPPTVASAEVVALLPDAGEYQSRVGVAIYRPSGSEETVEGSGPICQLEPVGQQGSVQRVVWTDFDRWQLEKMAFPPGVTVGQHAGFGPLPNSFAADVSLTATGLTGRLSLPVEMTSSSAVFLTGWGPALAVQIDKQGIFSAEADAELPANRFSNAALIDDQTQRRESLLRELLTAPGRPRLPAGPTLLCWTRSWETDNSLGVSGGREGEALVIAPLRVTRPDPGSVVRIPAAWIPFEAVAGLDGSPPTSAYSNTDRTWVAALSRETNISLRFQLPPFLLPVELHNATLSAEIHAPDRDVQFFGWQAASPQLLASERGPVRRQFSILVEERETLRLDPAGGLVISIDVGRHTNSEQSGLAAAGWRIANVYLSVTAAVRSPE